MSVERIHLMAYCPHCRQAWNGVAGEYFIHRPCPALLKPTVGKAEELRTVPNVADILSGEAVRRHTEENKPRMDAATVRLKPLLPQWLAEGRSPLYEGNWRGDET